VGWLEADSGAVLQALTIRAAALENKASNQNLRGAAVGMSCLMMATCSGFGLVEGMADRISALPDFMSNRQDGKVRFYVVPL
jgi:hypothetical protein